MHKRPCAKSQQFFPSSSAFPFPSTTGRCHQPKNIPKIALLGMFYPV